MGLCKNGQIDKMGKTSFKRKNYHSEEVLEFVHTNLCGPIEIKSYSGDKFSIIFVDDCNVSKRKIRSFSKIQVISGKSRKRNWKEVEMFEIRKRW